MALSEGEAADVAAAGCVAATLGRPAPPLVEAGQSDPGQAGNGPGTELSLEDQASPAQPAFAAAGLGGGGFSGLSCLFDQEM